MEKYTDKQIKKFSSRMQARLLLVFCVVSLLMVGLMGRLIYIMQTDGDRYAKQVLSRQSYVSAVLPYERGEILDRKGTVLAKSELMYRLILDPKLLVMNEKSITPTVNALKDGFGVTEEAIQEILKDKPESQYVILQKEIKQDKVDKFKKVMKENSDIMGVFFEEEFVRTYPYQTLACDVIGFTSATDDTGHWGLEEYYNKELQGTNGREYGYYDASLNIERIVKKPENGNSIVSTIDANVQRIVQKHINTFNAETGSKNIGVLVMNPNTGEILAMASNQEYDLNTPRDLTKFYTPEELSAMTETQKTEALNKLWKNDVISMGYEPGSTFKPVTVAAGLEENLTNEDQTYVCDGGENVGGVYIKDNKTHGVVTLGEALMESCNDTMMQLVNKEGKDIFWRYENDFGFGKKTGIDLPGEETGLLIPYDNLHATELATSSFGQSLNVTMVQMGAAFSSLVNGGNYYEPHMVKQIINDKGATVKQFDPILVRQTVSKKTSDFIQKYMYKTVEEGTAKGAKVPGYAIGGKTGTAQKYPREAKKYLVSFLGAAPAVNPEVVIYVIIDEPQNVPRQDNSGLATKFAGDILKEILPALNIFPEGDIDYLLPSTDGTATPDGTANTTNGSTTEQGGQSSPSTDTANSNQNGTSAENQTQEGNTQNSNQNNVGQNGGNQDGTTNNTGQNTGDQDTTGQNNATNTSTENTAQNTQNANGAGDNTANTPENTLESPAD